MAFFNKKADEKPNNALEKFGLKIEEYDSEQLRKKNIENLEKIQNELFGKGLLKAGMTLNFTTKVEERLKVGYLSIMIEQGWIQIRQNEMIIKELQKLNKVKA